MRIDVSVSVPAKAVAKLSPNIVHLHLLQPHQLCRLGAAVNNKLTVVAMKNVMLCWTKRLQPIAFDCRLRRRW